MKPEAIASQIHKDNGAQFTAKTEEMIARAITEAVKSERDESRAEISVLRALIEQIDQMLRVPAAEFVPAIADVFTLIDRQGRSSMTKDKGLFQKYRVERVDGKPIPEGCIVLEWDDPNAQEGIAAFSRSVRQAGYTQLADELDGKLREIATKAIAEAVKSEREKVERLEATVERYEEALKFYAEESKWFMRDRTVDLQNTTAVFHVDDPSKLPTEWKSQSYECTARLKMDQGRTAREALSGGKS